MICYFPWVLRMLNFQMYIEICRNYLYNFHKIICIKYKGMYLK
jgi:hypothetical protein